MADKDYSQLASATTAADTDLLAVYPSGGPLKKYTFASFIAQVVTRLGTTYLQVTNNLSDLASASSARANLGLGSAATLASTAVFQVANNFSEVASAATARTNIGAAASTGPTITGGMTIAGSVKQNVQAVASTAFDLSLTDVFTKSISADTTFTFANATASQAQAFVVFLTVSSSAVATWPAGVKWSGGSEPPLSNGLNVVGFITADGGTTWVGVIGALAVA